MLLVLMGHGPPVELPPLVPEEPAPVVGPPPALEADVELPPLLPAAVDPALPPEDPIVLPLLAVPLLPPLVLLDSVPVVVPPPPEPEVELAVLPAPVLSPWPVDPVVDPCTAPVLGEPPVLGPLPASGRTGSGRI